MTEEEIEKQAEENLRKNKISNNENWEVGGKHCYTLCKQAFKDGAKWGMEHAIEWHDLRKDPTDLPKEKGEYRVYFYDSELKANRNVNWYYYGKSWGCRLDVIAWCELPKYKE